MIPWHSSGLGSLFAVATPGATEVVVGLLGALTLGSAVLVVTLRNLYHCALFLALSFTGVAGLYVVLSAEFLAAVQVLIYVGAITVLILFAVMLTERITDARGEVVARQKGPALLLAAVLALMLADMVYATPWAAIQAPVLAVHPSTTMILGRELLTTYLIPFEVASVILLAALVGAVVLAKQEDTDVEEELQ
jgi:NADH-quinone oxidoreductase subunit J